MEGFHTNIEKDTLANKYFRKVVYTGKHTQLVYMSIEPGGEIGSEVHNGTDQFFRFEGGKGKVFIDNNEYDVEDGSGVIVPSGARHNVKNTSDTEPLQLYTLYSPPHHKDGVVYATKEEADAADEEFDGKTTE